MFLCTNETKNGLVLRTFSNSNWTKPFIHSCFDTIQSTGFDFVKSNKVFDIIQENSYLFELLLETPVLLGAEILLNGTAALLR